MISRHTARAAPRHIRCGPRILRTLRLSTPATMELCRSQRRSHTIRFGHATVWKQWPASSFVRPRGVARTVVTGAVPDVVGGGGAGKASNPSSTHTPTMTTTTTLRSIKTGAGAGAGISTGAVGSAARVIGVLQAAATGVGGSGEGGNSSNRQLYWASDDPEGAFVAEPGPPQSIEVGEN